jgi:hypothetical protein
MTLKLGRVDLGTMRISWTHAADRLRITGWTEIREHSKQLTQILRQQLLGYVASDDEPSVPVVWDEEPTLSGFYRVTGANVEGEGFLAFLGMVRWSVELERVTGFTAPLIELASTGAPRSGAEGWPEAVIAVPDGARSVGFCSTDSAAAWVPFAPRVVRSGAFGGVKIYVARQMLTQYYIDPGRFYEGAATLMMGDGLPVVVGRQAPNLPHAWRLSNGLYEIEPSGEDWFELRHRMWLDGAWTPWEPFLWYSTREEGGFGREPMPHPHSIVVLRNSPVEVAVRLLVTANGEYSPVTVDLSLKRGARAVSIELQSVFMSQFAVQGAGVDWQQDEPWYVWGDKGGVRHFIASNQDVGRLSGGGTHPNEHMVTFVKEWSLTIGACDSDGDGYESLLMQIQAWFWAAKEWQRVVMQ